MSDSDDSERVEADDGRAPHRRSLHDAVHDCGITHDCYGGWIDDHDWERLADALLARGWTAPVEMAP